MASNITAPFSRKKDVCFRYFRHRISVCHVGDVTNAVNITRLSFEVLFIVQRQIK